MNSRTFFIDSFWFGCQMSDGICQVLALGRFFPFQLGQQPAKSSPSQLGDEGLLRASERSVNLLGGTTT